MKENAPEVPARPPPVVGKTRATHRPHTQTRARPGAALCAQQWERGTDPTGCPSTRTTAKTTGETEACTPGEGVAGTKERALSGRPRGLLLGADRRPGLHHRPHCDFLHPMPEGTAPRKAHAVPAEEGTASRDPRLLDCTGPRKHRPAPGISWEWAPEQGQPWKVLAPLTRRRRLEAETRFRVPLLAGARRWLVCGCHFLSGSPDRMKRGRSGHGRVTRLQSFGRCACPRGVRGRGGKGSPLPPWGVGRLRGAGGGLFCRILRGQRTGDRASSRRGWWKPRRHGGGGPRGGTTWPHVLERRPERARSCDTRTCKP